MAKPKKLPQGISLSAEGRYRVRIYWRGTQHSIGNFHTLGDAKAAMEIARSEMARGIFIPPSELRRERASEDVLALIAATTVSEWAGDWIARLESIGRTPATIRSYRSTLDAHIVPALGTKRLIDVTSDDIDAMLDGLKGKPGAWTNTARVARSLFLAAVAANKLDESPFNVAIESTRRGAKRPLTRSDVATPAQVAALADAMPKEQRLAVLLAAWCALRLGEVLGLQRRDFSDLEDPESATLHVARQWNSKASPPAYSPPKADSQRVISIPAALVPAIVAHLEAFTPAAADAPVFPRAGAPRLPMSQTRLDSTWRAARETVMPGTGFRFHQLRHTGLTEYAKTGATIAEIQARGGHSSVEVALRYQHATRERDRANVARMAVDIGGGGADAS